MTRVRVDDREFEARPGETLLDALTREGIAVEHSCRAGICRSCEVRLTTGTVEARGGSPSLPEGRVLACSAVPTGDRVEVSLDAGTERTTAVLIDKAELAPSVLRLRFRVDGDWEFAPGQYAVLYGPVGLARPYSIASQPEDGFVEFHVRRVPEGRMTGWLFDYAEPGAEVALGPADGACVYRSPGPDEPLILAGVGTGLAPLWGIVNQARLRGHKGPIVLVQAAAGADRLYLHEELRTMAESWEPLRYRAAVLGDPGDLADAEEKDLGEMIRELVPEPRGWRAFLAGAPDIVSRVQRQLVVEGLSPFAAHADAFVLAPRDRGTSAP